MAPQGTEASTRAPLAGVSSSAQNSAAGTKRQQEFDTVKDKQDDEPPKKRKASSKSKKQENTDTNANDDLDVSSIHLDGEDTDSVQVYETCDMIRDKISAHLNASSGLTKAAFCRTLHQQLHGPSAPKKLTVAQLASFQAKSGYDSGNTSSVFYTAYVYFEKLRIKQGKPKSNDRQQMEKIWSKEGGFDVKRVSTNKAMWMRFDEKLTVDKYGQSTITQGRRVVYSGPL